MSAKVHADKDVQVIEFCLEIHLVGNNNLFHQILKGWGWLHYQHINGSVLICLQLSIMV